VVRKKLPECTGGEMKKAIITGVTGQDGAYLSRLLLEKDYEVYGFKRRSSLISTDRVDSVLTHKNFKLLYFDLNDTSAIWDLLIKIQPDEIYNLAAQSHVRVSFDLPEHTVDGIAMGTLRMLNAMKTVCPHARFYQASSSEMFGDNPNIPLNEESKFMPASPYACAKTFAHNLIRNYRKSYGIHASSGILFNHESPMRGETFVTRKITLAAANIKLGLQDKLFLGNLDAKRDWGFAGDYVKAMWKMLQQEIPDDYVIATGETHTVRDFLECVFSHAGLNPDKFVEIDERLFRPHEVPLLLGDNSKAKTILKWKPEIHFEQLCEMMFRADYKFLSADHSIREG
jgi:GDPmannose 4,6-dehydratase